MSVDSAKSFHEQWPSRMSRAKASTPDAVKGFHALFQAVMKEGALTVPQKELLALVVGMALRCDPCVYAHVQKARQAGATRQQVIEAAGVVVMMQGGPAYTYLPKVVEALDALEVAGPTAEPSAA
jgi:AhpD family alkylhydroperoxidase